MCSAEVGQHYPGAVVKRVISLVRPLSEYAGSVIHSGDRDILDKVQIRMIRMIHGIYRNKLRKSGMTTKKGEKFKTIRLEIIVVLECDSTEYSADSAAHFFGTRLSDAYGCLFSFCLSQGLGPLLN